MPNYNAWHYWGHFFFYKNMFAGTIMLSFCIKVKIYNALEDVWFLTSLSVHINCLLTWVPAEKRKWLVMVIKSKHFMDFQHHNFSFSYKNYLNKSCIVSKTYQHIKNFKPLHWTVILSPPDKNNMPLLTFNQVQTATASDMALNTLTTQVFLTPIFTN